MASKRDHSDLDEGEVPELPVKRSKGSSKKSRQHQNSSIDPTWGQKYVFASNQDATTIPAGEESDFEDDADAMAYLTSVRNEALGIPHLLVAPKVQIGPQLPDDFKKPPEADDGSEEGECASDGEGDAQVDRSIYVNGIGDSRGYYEDGAYMALPEVLQNGSDDGEMEDLDDDDDEGAAQSKLHEAYFSALLDQYRHLRAILNSTPPPNARSRLSPTQRTEADPPHRKSSSTRVWSNLLYTTDPHPLQLALMSKDSVLRILRVLLGGKFLRSGRSVDERTSRWLWALLARLPEPGELNYSEVGWVRDLGRRAVLLGRSLSEMAALRDELAEGALGVHEGVDGSSSDEDVAAEEDSAPADVGLDSPGADTDVTAPTSDIEPEEYSRDAGTISEAAHEPNKVAGDDEPDVATPTARVALSEENSVREEPQPGPEGSQATDKSDRVLSSAETEATAPTSDIEPDEKPKTNKQLPEQDEGEVAEDPNDEDVAMDIESDASIEDGEAVEEDDSAAASRLEDARKRLLDQLEASAAAEEEDEQLRAEQAARERARMNMRATLCMILTVAGEFYGQRDLLEFREPFVGI